MLHVLEEDLVVKSFGLQMFLKKSPVLHPYDKTLWRRCWQSTRNTTKGYLTSPSFNVLDVADQNERNWTIAEDNNVIILQYFIAEVFRYKDKLRACCCCFSKKLFHACRTRSAGKVPRNKIIQ